MLCINKVWYIGKINMYLKVGNLLINLDYIPELDDIPGVKSLNFPTRLTIRVLYGLISFPLIKHGYLHPAVGDSGMMGR